MMKYILDDLMTIRDHREKEALSRILKARKILEDAKRSAEEKTEELISFARWRVNEEKRLFDEIKNTIQRRCYLDYFLQSVDELKEKQNILKKQLIRAKQCIAQAEDEVQKANKVYAMRHREKKKLQEHKQKWRQRMMMIELQNEENNLDELGMIRFNTMHA
jgi:hypothetical protein